MSPAPEITRTVTVAGARPPVPLARADAPALARRIAARFRAGPIARVAWTLGRTGRSGIVGLALLLAAGVFWVSTHLPIAADVEALRAQVAAASGRARPVEAPDRAQAPAAPLRTLPARADVPAILRQLFERATQARLAVDSGKYEVSATPTGAVVRHQITFPVSGPYPQIRAFLDATLANMPALSLTELALERKSISDANVEAQIRMTAFTTGAGPTAPPDRPAAARAADARASSRVVAPAHAAALFAQHTWLVIKPAPPPPPPPPPPEPTAPPLPFAFLGSFTPDGEKPVYFLAHGDRVIDARVGDKLDGTYQLESAAGGQLVFVYLPLNARQTLAGEPK